MKPVFVGYREGGALIDVEPAAALRDALTNLGLTTAAEVISHAIHAGRAMLDDSNATDVVAAIDALTKERRFVQHLRGLRMAIRQELLVRQKTRGGARVPASSSAA